MKMPPARATTMIAVATIASYFILAVAGLSETADFIGGFIPARLGGIELEGALPVWITPLSATLLHAGIVHLGFNLLILVYCGRSVEAAVGTFGTLLLYLIGAYAAALAQYLASPLDMSPMIGASGAISALFGAYALLFGRPRDSNMPPRVAYALNVVWLAVAWVGIQLMIGFAMPGAGFTVAIWAHIGGFLAGLLLARPLLLLKYRSA
ncbi:rhomboid family intramembrane serine protease [Sphingomonas crocodyli]|uniref:Rhomboid family intramembrane serine protease n=1 Tax=Sphingomonas crocodyli TaxID=1979270 RepID=A0A437LZL8_9SPHN|nr:rhomboid family intramembrane serine protease [Sphingomonas crocodyli]RVT90878.1 rhomboid family intramembrane serine protease [Sphingomonas crocodyli]